MRRAPVIALLLVAAGLAAVFPLYAQSRPDAEQQAALSAVAAPLYDQLADRWVIAQSAFDSSDASVHECFAVSTTPDPTGEYYIYDFPLGATAQAGTHRLGLWPDGYYVTVNQVEGFDPAGIGTYAFDRNALLEGGSATSVYANTAMNAAPRIANKRTPFRPRELNGIVPR